LNSSETTGVVVRRKGTDFMLDRLNSEEQRVLLELLIFMAKADGKVVDIEDEVLHQYAELLDVDFDELDGNLGPDQLIPQLENPASRVIVLQEMLRLAHIDGLFSDDEQEAILTMAQYMGIPTDLLQRVDEWVLEGLKWVWQGEELLQEANEVVR
jgi:tellurite resistance protein